jgi:hypothetical protein
LEDNLLIFILHYSGRKKYGTSASKLGTLAELYYRPHTFQRVLFLYIQILDRRRISSIKQKNMA